MGAGNSNGFHDRGIIMSIPAIPSITEIKNRIISDIEIKVNQTVPILPLAFTKVLASAIAGFIYLNYQATLWVYKQIFPASSDYFNLVLLGAIVDIEPTEAVQAVLLCDIPGTGAQVNAGTLFVGTNNITYQVTTNTPIVTGMALNVPCLALTSLTSGEIGNLGAGEILDIVNTDLNLTGTAEVASTQTTGADEESRESFSARVGLRYRTRFIAGTPGGYALYGLETPHFIWVGPYADSVLPGVVNVYGRVDNQTDGIPTTAQLATLKSYLSFDPDTGLETRRPISDTLNTLPITSKEFDLAIYVHDSNSELNAQIEDAVNDYIATLEPYIIGVSGTRKDVLTNTDIAGVGDAIAGLEGAKVTQVILTDVLTSSAETNYTFYGGETGKFRNITFVVVP